MPTAPKLVAFIWYALIAWFASSLVIPYLPEGTQIGRLSLICAVLGGIIGWSFAGSRAGDTMRAAYGYGLTAIALVTLSCLFYFSFETMIKRSMAKRYDGPMEALTSCVELMVENAIYVVQWDVLTVLLVGGVFGGWLVEKTGRRWP